MLISRAAKNIRFEIGGAHQSWVAADSGDSACGEQRPRYPEVPIGAGTGTLIIMSGPRSATPDCIMIIHILLLIFTYLISLIVTC